MTVQLNPVQRRVLGVLIEKSLTTPGSYPLTLNALVAGCNQLTCREPVMHLTETEVTQAIGELKKLRIVLEPDYEPGSRVDRFRHNAQKHFGWDAAQQAIMAELLVRGPQTAGELKGNASRMAPIPDLHTTSQILEGLAAQSPPMVSELPRQPGKSVIRFNHGFSVDEAASSIIAPATKTLESRVAQLEMDVAALKRAMGAAGEPGPTP